MFFFEITLFNWSFFSLSGLIWPQTNNAGHQSSTSQTSVCLHNRCEICKFDGYRNIFYFRGEHFLKLIQVCFIFFPVNYQRFGCREGGADLFLTKNNKKGVCVDWKCWRLPDYIYRFKILAYWGLAVFSKHGGRVEKSYRPKYWADKITNQRILWLRGDYWSRKWLPQMVREEFRGLYMQTFQIN